MKNRTLMVMSLFAMLAVTFAWGQVPMAQSTNVPFKFTAGTKVLPAGRYDFVHYSDSTPWLTIRNASGDIAVKVKIITRLARDTSSSDTVRLVFDKVDDQHFLSEVWLPERDGLLVRGTAEAHKHEIVRPSK